MLSAQNKTVVRNVVVLSITLLLGTYFGYTTATKRVIKTPQSVDVADTVTISYPDTDNLGNRKIVKLEVYRCINPTKYEGIETPPTKPHWVVTTIYNDKRTAYYCTVIE